MWKQLDLRGMVSSGASEVTEKEYNRVIAQIGVEPDQRPPAWTDKPPTVPGLWVRYNPRCCPLGDIIHVTKSSYGDIMQGYGVLSLLESRPGTLWLGPLSEPNEETTDG